MKQIIVERPQERGGVYVIINLIKKKVYIGETMDFYRRIPEHIRSLLGDENSSNRNLKKEECKTFEIFHALLTNYDKTTSFIEKRDWIVDETIYMYLFRKYGFTLYNGNDTEGYCARRDNADRSFLLNEEITGEYLNDEFKNYLKDKSVDLYGYDTWEDFIEAADRELNKDIQLRFHKNLSEISKLEEDECITLWKDRLKEVKEDKSYYLVNEKNFCTICRQLFSVKLSIADMQQCKLEEKSIENIVDLIEDNKLDRILVSKFGHYLEQGPMTILSTKVYDIKNNRLSDLDGLNLESNESGICFWALRRLPIDNTRKFLSFDGKDKGSRYALLSYTPSRRYAFDDRTDGVIEKDCQRELNLQENENIEDFFKRIKNLELEKGNIALEKFAFGYGLTKKDIKNKRGRKYPYPEKMFPEVVSKSEINSALLISELSYIHGDFKDPKKIYEFFESHSASGGVSQLSITLRGSNSHSCAELQKRQELIDYLTNSENQVSDGLGKTSFLMARLEYPYIIALNNG